MRRRLASAVFGLAGVGLALTAVGQYRASGRYGERLKPDVRADRRFDMVTGELQSIAYDADGDLRTDSWASFDHGRLVRLVVDADADGIIDREYTYDASGEAHVASITTENTP
jgi:hypothetical protein